jgi:hypothetical protein
MEKKILMIMVSLMVVAIVVVATVMIATGGARSTGGFTKLLNSLENDTPSVTYGQYLSMPSDWELGDRKTVSDTIVDMDPRSEWYEGGITIYTVRLYFMYIDDKWADDEAGVMFYVPSTEHHDGWMQVSHGMFWLDVSSPDNISDIYNIGDTIELWTDLEINDANDGELSFSEWLLGD